MEEVSDDNWEKELNPTSEVIYPNALADPSLSAMGLKVEGHVQVRTCMMMVY